MRGLEPLAAGAIRRWGGDPSSLEFVQESMSSLWRFRRGARLLYLRLTGPRRSREQLLFEAHWMRHLDERGFLLAPPIRSESGEWVEPFDHEGARCHACVFAAARGRLPDYDARISRRPSLDWTPEHQVELGRTIGRLHRLTSGYAPPSGLDRPSWSDDPALAAPLPADLEGERATVLAWLGGLPPAGDLVHADVLIGNYFLLDGRIELIDFDDSIRAWNAYDLAVPLYVAEHAPVIAATIGPTPGLKDRLVAGYLEEHPMEQSWIDRIPGLVRYRRILILAHCHRKGATDGRWYRRHLDLLSRGEPLL